MTGDGSAALSSVIVTDVERALFRVTPTCDEETGIFVGRDTGPGRALKIPEAVA
jgi:hypothetical protein